MHADLTSHETHTQLRAAGLAYLVIIIAGVSSDMAFRSEALAATDAVTQVLALRISLMLDTVMLGADAVLAVLLFTVFRAVNPTMALSAMVLRLLQAATIGASLMLQLVAVHDPSQTALMLAVQADGYDLGLIFFAGNTALMAVLLCHSGITPKWLSPALMASAIVYAAGGLAALLSPEFAAKMEFAYVIPLIAETGFCFWLLFGRRKQQAIYA